MKINLSFVPPGGGKIEYSLVMDMPEIPRLGDYISITRPGQTGAETFIVKRAWWNLEVDESKPKAAVKEIQVECEFAVSKLASEDHRRTCQDYHARNGRLLEFDVSMY